VKSHESRARAYREAGRPQERPASYLQPSTDYFAAAAFDLASAHADFDIDTQPVPLQLFMPLQLFFADLHSDVPLHEFTPSQCTVAGAAAVSAANDTVGKAEVNNIAAAPASAALDSFVICMIESSIVVERSDIAAPLQRPGQRGDYYSTI
jgi:hypothetical protein